MRAYLELIRFPLFLTALADSAAGYLIGLPDLYAAEPASLALVAFASACLYSAGMALNDVADVHRDATLHPSRPLPAGRLETWPALRFGLILLGVGVAAAAVAGAGAMNVGALLALSILAYNFLLKRWRLVGAAGMGAARALNFLLGYAAVRPLWRMDRLDQASAVAVFTYIALTTFLSTFEEGRRPRWLLAGIFALFMVTLLVPAGIGIDARFASLSMGLLMAALLAPRAWAVMRDPSSESVSQTIRLLVLGVIPFDAALVLSANLPLAAAALLGLLPLTLLGSWSFRRA